METLKNAALLPHELRFHIDLNCGDKQQVFFVENKWKPCCSNTDVLGKMLKEQDCASGAENSRTHAEPEASMLLFLSAACSTVS